MDTLQFLERIFPGCDELVICVHKPDQSGNNKRGFLWNRGSFDRLDKAAAAIARWDAEPDTTVYYSIGSFADNVVEKEDGKLKYLRTKECATYFKTLCLDLDIGSDKPYQNQKDGWIALKAAIEGVGLPTPMLISSGNGIHAYWPLQERIKKEQWEKVSIALRIALEEQGVEIDTSKIHDASMVLRPVGTHHKKQQPWKEVALKLDSPDFDIIELATILKPWFGKAVQKVTKHRAGPAKKSSVADAILVQNDIELDKVAESCNQINAIILSGGVSDAAGMAVEEPMWRATLGFAKYCTDVPAAVTALAGGHPDFDLDDSLDKLDGWKGTGPTTCAKFEQMCGKGCAGCPHKGAITSPAQLSVITEDEVETESGEEIKVEMPQGYVEFNGWVYREVESEVETTDANGDTIKQKVTDRELVSTYPMHITGIYKNTATYKTTIRLAIKYPLEGWKEEDHEIDALSSSGKDFNSLLLNRQIYTKNIGQLERIRGYLMDYLTMVQMQKPSGKDYTSFGWQDDDSFLCGHKVIGAPEGDVERRLKGSAEQFAKTLVPTGSRDKWIEAMEMINTEHTKPHMANVLLAMGSILGRASGNSTLVSSIYSAETTTGKSVALMAVNSLIGKPKALMQSSRDTLNATYNMRGTLNSLPYCIDEITQMDAKVAVGLVYDLSHGREKTALTQQRVMRTPAEWTGPSFVSTNTSILTKFDDGMTANDPLRARTMEFRHDDRTFVTPDSNNVSVADTFVDLILDNYGWAYPELVEAVFSMGGDQVVYEKGFTAFNKKLSVQFQAQDRFIKSNIINAWTVGNIAKRLGLIQWDVDAVAEYMYNVACGQREDAVKKKLTGIDMINEFMHDHASEIVVSVGTYQSKEKPQVRMPPPKEADIRLDIVKDTNNPVMPGSTISINRAALKRWAKDRNDDMSRIIHELRKAQALVDDNRRVSIFKGCPDTKPGQAYCVVVNLNHPDFASGITGADTKAQSPITLAVLQGAEDAS